MRLRRPALRELLLAMMAVALVLPLAGLLFLRLYESALIRQTESELISQAAVLSAAFKIERLARPGGDTPHLDAVPGPLDIARRPGLDLARDTILPPAPDPAPAGPADPAALSAGAALAPVLHEAQGTTLASMRLLDARGVIVATTGQDLGRSLAGLAEVRRALQGEPASQLRQRERKATWVPEGISRGAMLRVYVALPVIDGDRLLGAVVVARTPADIVQALWGKRRELGALALVVLGLGVAMALAASRLVTRPLARVTDQAARVAAGETGAIRPLDRPGTREVAALSAAITAMAATLERRADYVRTLAAHIAHEFKTPLAAVRGAAELLGDHAMSDAERRHFAGVVETEVARLDRLTRRLLDLARADMAGVGDHGPVPVGPVLHRLASRFDALGLRVGMPDSTAYAAVGGETLDSMLEGLLDNALTHAGTGARVELGVQEAAGRVLIRVTDDGPGVSPANAARVFTPFFTTARQQGGTGLGLPIVQALAAGAGGSVRLVPSDAGAVFELDLPAAQLPATQG